MRYEIQFPDPRVKRKRYPDKSGFLHRYTGLSHLLRADGKQVRSDHAVDRRDLDPGRTALPGNEVNRLIRRQNINILLGFQAVQYCVMYQLNNLAKNAYIIMPQILPPVPPKSIFPVSAIIRHIAQLNECPK